MGDYTLPMTRWIFLLSLIALLSACVVSPGPDKNLTPLVQSDFRSGDIPDGWVELNGQVSFANGAMQLPAAPAALHGVMFGPAFRENIRVTARFSAEANGGRFPEFGLGVNGAGGYRVMVSPEQQKLILFRSDVSVHETDHTWVPGDWTHLAMQIRRLPGLKWSVSAKVWHSSQLEPTDWQFEWTEYAEPLPGRTTVWGRPVSGKPIAVDDLQVWQVE